MIMEHPQDLPALKNHDPILNSRSDEDDEDDEEYDDDRPVSDPDRAKDEIRPAMVEIMNNLTRFSRPKG